MHSTMRVCLVYVASICTLGLCNGLSEDVNDDDHALLQTRFSQRPHQILNPLKLTVHRMQIAEEDEQMSLLQGHREENGHATVYQLCSANSDGDGESSVSAFGSLTDTCQPLGVFAEHMEFLGQAIGCEAFAVQAERCFLLLESSEWFYNLNISDAIQTVSASAPEPGSNVVLIDATSVTKDTVHRASALLESSLGGFDNPHLVFLGGEGAVLMEEATGLLKLGLLMMKGAFWVLQHPETANVFEQIASNAKGFYDALGTSRTNSRGERVAPSPIFGGPIY